MANIDAPVGARWIGHRRGMPISGSINSYAVAVGDATALFVGDFVTLTGNGVLGDDGTYRQVVTQAAAADPIVGFVVGFAADPDSLNSIYRTASTARIAFVVDDPDAYFELQGSGTFAATSLGNNADITVGAGSTSTGLSGMELDLSTEGSATAQIRIVGVSERPNQEVGANTKLICYINEHQYKSTTGI